MHAVSPSDSLRLTHAVQTLVLPKDVYLFTLYWTFILYAPLFLITGTCASLFIALEPLRRVRTRASSSTPDKRTKAKAPKPSRKRSIAYGAAVFLAYAIAGTLLTVFGSTVVGFLIAGVYAAGKFKVSTCVACCFQSGLQRAFSDLTDFRRWVPFVWALLQCLVAVTRSASISYNLSWL